jgi:hypothetical protein
MIFRSSGVRISGIPLSMLNAHPFRSFGCHLLLLVSLMLFMYEANCGVNYYREPFVDRETFETAEFTEDDLTGFCELSVSKLYGDNPRVIVSISEI